MMSSTTFNARSSNHKADDLLGEHENKHAQMCAAKWNKTLATALSN